MDHKNVAWRVTKSLARAWALLRLAHEQLFDTQHLLLQFGVQGIVENLLLLINLAV